jgi:hypothetical protein
VYFVGRCKRTKVATEASGLACHLGLRSSVTMRRSLTEEGQENIMSLTTIWDPPLLMYVDILKFAGNSILFCVVLQIIAQSIRMV